MRLLKIRLADDKIYTFSTFTVLEQIAMKKKFEGYSNLEDKKDKLLFEIDEKGEIKKDSSGNWIPKILTPEIRTKLAELEQFVLNAGVDILRKSLSRRHPEFKIVGDAAKDLEINNQILGLIDMTDFKKLIPFAMSGDYVRENEIIFDISAEGEVEKKPDGK